MSQNLDYAGTAPRFNSKLLFIASCVSLVTTSMVFAIRGDIGNDMAGAFHLTQEQLGLIWGPSFWGFTLAIFISAPLVDVLGMRILHALSALGYIVGVLLVIFAPHPAGPVTSIFADTGTGLLYAGFLIMGLSQGLVEGVINPLVATIHSQNKTQKLNMLHAWWPGGMIIGGLLAFALTKAGVAWQVKLSLLLVPAITYLIMAISLRYPPTERVASKISTGDMFKEALKPLFLLMFICMWMTAATELAPDQWFPSVMGALVPQFAGGGVLFLVYTAGLMFVLRTFAGPVAHRLSPLGMLMGCSILSALGLWWLGSLQAGTTPVVALAAATVFGIGKTYFWPTMLGVTSERFPRGGALLMGLMGGAGMLSVAVALPIMGSAFDKQGAGHALQLVGYLPIILTFIFGALFLGFKAKGGYKPVTLSTEEAIPAGEL